MKQRGWLSGTEYDDQEPLAKAGAFFGKWAARLLIVLAAAVITYLMRL